MSLSPSYFEKLPTAHAHNEQFQDSRVSLQSMNLSPVKGVTLGFSGNGMPAKRETRRQGLESFELRRELEEEFQITVALTEAAKRSLRPHFETKGFVVDVLETYSSEPTCTCACLMFALDPWKMISNDNRILTSQFTFSVATRRADSQRTFVSPETATVLPHVRHSKTRLGLPGFKTGSFWVLPMVADLGRSLNQDSYYRNQIEFNRP